MKVLVVDDDVVSRMVLMHLVDSCGTFDIVEAEDGADAWQQLEAGLRPAICFCDLRMPRLSGMELLQRIKQHAELQAMPFVLVTSATDGDTVRLASDAGAAGYVVKPFQADQVRVHLARFLTPPAPAPGEGEHHAETPAATQLRLGINAERLLVYLGGFQSQLAAAGEELHQLQASGDQQETRLRLERLHTGCVTLGLHGAAAGLLAVLAGQLSGMNVQAVLSGVQRAVARQADLTRQALG
ncbi:response regulator [Duganella sp. LX47W]|uniref:Response regulator n=2 Tax=Rugamonas apoptosis TaxID=2758570 RepID=A0A7W2FE80_9BURK|nr:response regulator [Rugamonas apoptosis]